MLCVCCIANKVNFWFACVFGIYKSVGFFLFKILDFIAISIVFSEKKRKKYIFEFLSFRLVTSSASNDSYSILLRKWCEAQIRLGVKKVKYQL